MGKQWDFDGDGIIDSYEQNPSHTYNNAGIFDVTLKINSNTWSDSLKKVNFIVVQNYHLPAPENLTISQINNDIKLDWDPIQTRDFQKEDIHYLIYCSTQPWGEYSFLDYTSQNITEYYHHNVLSNKDKLFYFIIGYVGDFRSLLLYIDNNKKYFINKNKTKKGGYDE